MSMGIVPGGFQFTRKFDQGRFSSGGGSTGVERMAAPSVTSAAESGAGWNDADGEGGAPGEEEEEGEGGGEGEEDGEEGEGEGEEDKAVGPFTDTCLEMARLRLPHMELGFEEDGFFGIDVRSLIIGREIARGAYGVVHEGKLLRSRPKDEGEDEGEDEGGADGEQPGVLICRTLDASSYFCVCALTCAHVFG